MVADSGRRSRQGRPAGGQVDDITGRLARPENLGGYLYRVALNHLRNHRRKDRSALSSAEALDELAASEHEADWESVRGRQWAAAARRISWTSSS